MPTNILDDNWFTGQPYTPPAPQPLNGMPAIQGSPGAGTSGGLATSASPPGLQIPGGQGNSPFGWRMPGRRIPMPMQNPIEGANQQAQIANALSNFTNQYPNWQTQFQGLQANPVQPPVQQGLDPMLYAGGQIGAHGPLNYLGQPIVKGNG